MSTRVEVEVLTAAEVAGILRCSTENVAKLVKSKRLAGVNLGGQLGLRVRRVDLDAFVSGRRATPAATTRRAAK